ncbi:transcriptional regulator [Chitinophaga oryziterrae]|uniref:Transcriptional regulator n=1 Tax=Chitinophaga oryziterrae TaxID=1031224 RepID=A0A6N8JIJ5_9BACT|nr:helix-turn-helix domain-containing protein [Chitinophaga oryziterrae]MVT45055.1 transcriptional regulator [Chitinophaga oryziterrae]
MVNKLENGKISDDCKRHFKAINDTLYILNGKWRVVIVACLASGKKRYLELQRIVEGIGPKMLSKELNKLELNGLITRSALETKPVTVEYELTEYARSLKPLTDEMAVWGKLHRDKVIKDMTAK